MQSYSGLVMVTTLKDEIFQLCDLTFDEASPAMSMQDPSVDYVIAVYNRMNVEEMKCVIPLQGILPDDIAGCSLSDCIYVLTENLQCQSILRITKDEENQFKMSPWIPDLKLVAPTISVSQMVA